MSIEQQLLAISGAESVDEALDIFKREREANGHMAGENERLRDGLQWYADGNHFDLDDWDTCSGESSNWLFPPIDWEREGPAWIIDNGGTARSILAGHSINPDEDADDITIAPEVKP